MSRERPPALHISDEKSAFFTVRTNRRFRWLQRSMQCLSVNSGWWLSLHLH